MIEYIQIFWLLLNMEYPRDPHINLFDHTKYIISVNQEDSLHCTIYPISPLAQQYIHEQLELQFELEVLDELAKQDSIRNINKVWDDEVEYYPDFGSDN